MTAHVVADLAYGDSGKGTTVDWLCRQGTVQSVIRFNGGPQAGHNVVLPDGRHHEFSQFGAGSFAGVPTFLSRYMAVDPLRLASEADSLRRIGVPEPYDALSIDAESLVVTPLHAIAQQRAEDARGEERHGSCGTGFGEAVKCELYDEHLAVRMKDLGSPVGMKKLSLLHDYYHDIFGAHFLHEYEVEPLDALWAAYTACYDRIGVVDGTKHLKALLSRGDVVFEGAQGVLLDEWYGFHPHTTWSTTTFENADRLVLEAGGSAPNRIGVTRSYMTRHGPGPFVTEAPLKIPEPHNSFNEWQREFRLGHFDAPAIKYAIAVCGGIDKLVFTHLDQTRHLGLFCKYYRDTSQIAGRCGEIVDIPIPERPDDMIERREITELLYRVQADYDAFDFDDQLQAVVLAGAVGFGHSSDILMCSWGPTYHDKSRNPWERKA